MNNYLSHGIKGDWFVMSNGMPVAKKETREQAEAAAKYFKIHLSESFWSSALERLVSNTDHVSIMIDQLAHQIAPNIHEGNIRWVETMAHDMTAEAGFRASGAERGTLHIINCKHVKTLAEASRTIYWQNL